MRSRVLLVGSLALLLMLAACGGSSSSSSGTTDTTTNGHVAKPVSADPSVSAKMVCEPEAVNDIAAITGVPAEKISTPTWIDHVYSCDYVYKNGAKMTLAVKEVANADETTAYFDSLSQKYGKAKDIQGVGDAAFTTKNGNVVVRKDYKILYIDTTKLPKQFGVPADTPANTALNVAATVMSCWVGA